MFTLKYQYGDRYPLRFDWLARIASTIARFWARWRRERLALLPSADLQALDDAMLKDIGVHRCMIDSAVLAGGRAEWYALVADSSWPAAAIPQARRLMPTRNLSERHSNNDI
jgi:uncharacterized protein YjiS (DUF1127 family)